MEMKKTMIFKTDESHDKWFQANAKKDEDLKFIENRVIVVLFQSENRFEAGASIECKKIETAIERFCKELTSNGFDVKTNAFKSILQDFKANFKDLVHRQEDYEVELMMYNDGSFYVRYECYQEEVEKFIEF